MISFVFYNVLWNPKGWIPDKKEGNMETLILFFSENWIMCIIALYLLVGGFLVLVFRPWRTIEKKGALFVLTLVSTWVSWGIIFIALIIAMFFILYMVVSGEDIKPHSQPERSWVLLTIFIFDCKSFFLYNDI